MKYLVIKTPTFNGARRNLWYDVGEVASGRPSQPDNAKYMHGIASYITIDPPAGSGALGVVIDADCLLELTTPSDLTDRAAVEEWLDGE